MRAALLQLCSGDDPEANLAATRSLIAEAAVAGAGFVLTPEVTNCVSASRERQAQVLCREADDPTLAALRDAARARGLWLLIGSLALKAEGEGQPFVNRSFLIGPDGAIAARYDKIHMFDVDIDATESYRESAGYRPGTQAVLAQTPFAQIGMTVCYDVRFPALHQSLALAGAQIFTAPAAFSPVTGAAHWHTLLRARAIETGCFVLAPAQTGTHASAAHKTRDTYGHSLAIDPWGEILLDAGQEPGVYFFDMDMEQCASARRRVPSLANRRTFSNP